MSDIDWFSFEKDSLDFPFYRKNPHVSKMGWIILFVSMFIGLLSIAIIDDEVIAGICFCLIQIIPLLYFLNWDYKAIIQKPSSEDIGVAIALFFGYMIYSIVMISILDVFSLSGSEIVSESAANYYLIVALIPLLMGEELLKFIPFMFFLRLIYKLTNNRKISVMLSMLIIMMFFGLLHASDMQSIISVLLVQGLGSIFEFYGYIETKNLVIPYITHLCTDGFLFIMMMLI